MEIRIKRGRAIDRFRGPLTFAGRAALCALLAHVNAAELATAPVNTGVAAALAGKWLLPTGSAPAARGPFAAQDPAQTAASTNLSVSVADGEGAINTIGQGASHPIVVRVQDAKGTPVEDAVVSFLLPADGPSGTFPNGTRNLSVTTDNLGRAIAAGFAPNTLTGVLEIRVTVTLRGEVAHAIVHQTNTVPAAVAPAATGGGTSSAATKKKSNTGLLLLIVGGAAAAGAVAALAGGKGSSSSSSGGGGATLVTVGISPGSGSIGPPH